eukprot:CAMPEP_0114626300 /NCGR_PEP_ID=MMETSP0168-20121206/11710_1 /TAXON_ID=95228 ORGANISM="Vannella sp., Strain DIVA3 517/6/12" /NCGR_SAMPLE_ID=MMETSP0168 /ASSEMBLY_ACC=CAM_ASM_000044 /LENGTH=77 /DNA_ID=CAMNT_0001837599 /DNA_START=538 /DNA_END=768 /DNA_ORIENTATION=+
MPGGGGRDVGYPAHDEDEHKANDGARLDDGAELGVEREAADECEGVLAAARAHEHVHARERLHAGQQQQRQRGAHAA